MIAPGIEKTRSWRPRRKSMSPPLRERKEQYFRTHLPPTLIIWGENDPIFPAEGAHPYLRDLPDAELHLLNTGHFALEEDGLRVVGLIREFMSAKVGTGTSEQ